MLLANTQELDRHKLFAGLGPEPLDESFTPAILDSVLAGKRAPIKAAYWISVWSPDWETSTCAKRCFAPAFLPKGLPLLLWESAPHGSYPPSKRFLKQPSRPGAPHCAITHVRTASWGISSITCCV